MTDAGTGRARHIEAPAPVGRILLTAAGEEVSGFLAGLRLARWSAADGRLLQEATYRGPEVTAVALSPRADQVAVATADGAVRLLEARTLHPISEMRRPPGPRGALVLSADGTLLA